MRTHALLPSIYRRYSVCLLYWYKSADTDTSALILNAYIYALVGFAGEYPQAAADYFFFNLEEVLSVLAVLVRRYKY